MNSEREQLRFSARREMLHQAVRDSDSGGAARAAARLRVDGFPLTPEEFGRAAAIRQAVGIAVLKARLPGHPAPRRAHTTPLVVRRSGAAWRAVAAAAVIALVLLLLWSSSQPTPGGGSPQLAVVPQQIARPLVVSRGRTITAVEVAVAEATPTPTASASAEPSASAQPESTARGTTPGTGGTGTGSGGGSGSGTGSGNGTAPSPPATPAPTATPVTPPAGFSRLNIIVYDRSTFRPLQDVCVVIGTISCDPSAPHTDASGRWSADVAASSASTRWDMYFIKAGFVTQHQQITLPGGVSRTYVIYLAHSAS